MHIFSISIEAITIATICIWFNLYVYMYKCMHACVRLCVLYMSMCMYACGAST